MNIFLNTETGEHYCTSDHIVDPVWKFIGNDESITNDNKYLVIGFDGAAIFDTERLKKINESRKLL